MMEHIFHQCQVSCHSEYGYCMETIFSTPVTTVQRLVEERLLDICTASQYQVQMSRSELIVKMPCGTQGQPLCSRVQPNLHIKLVETLPISMRRQPLNYTLAGVITLNERHY